MMKKQFLFVTLLLACYSCGKSAFVNEMQGKWKVTEINYLFDSNTQTTYPADMYFIFDNDAFQTLSGNTISEQGTFKVNPKVTQISFSSDLGKSTYLIEEQSYTYQHWKSKAKLIDFYLDFKLEKIE
jgi:hypothetical protein